jgi:hypothetical protein
MNVVVVQAMMHDIPELSAMLNLGAMKAGQSHAITVWMDESAVGVDLGRMIRLGAAGGERGRVLLWGDRGWFGADMEALR